MELFRETQIDFIGYRRYFIALSLVLLTTGTVSLVAHGGPRYGIDFKGGTLAYLKFRQKPDVAKLRAVLNERGLSVATLQPFEESSGSHELKVDLDLSGDAARNSGRTQIIEALHAVYPAEGNKLDLNNCAASPG